MAERITAIMDQFDRPHTIRTLDQVTQRTRLPRSTTYRILEQLIRLQWIDRTSTGYRLGCRSLALGGRENGHGALRTAAAPVLHELALRSNLVVHLAVLDGPEVYYLDKVGGRPAEDIPSRVGGRAPAHCTALGKALLAWQAPEYIDSEYPNGVEQRTSQSIGEVERLHRELGRVRASRGLAFERGEYDSRIACVGVALRIPHGAVGAISLAGGVDITLERVAPLIVRSARAIADALLENPGPWPV
ncbi:helix-turn-helix domain-containing protein [Nocardia sp. SYP-A9097]|nr:helix-turn-helix domain-containing protein [Nocardia sp. SYP-A9097]